MEVNNAWIERLSKIIEDTKKSNNNKKEKEQAYARLVGFCESLVEVYQITSK